MYTKSCISCFSFCFCLFLVSVKNSNNSDLWNTMIHDPNVAIIQTVAIAYKVLNRSSCHIVLNNVRNQFVIYQSVGKCPLSIWLIVTWNSTSFLLYVQHNGLAPTITHSLCSIKIAIVIQSYIFWVNAISECMMSIISNWQTNRN